MKMIYKTQLYRAKQLALTVWSLPSFLVTGFWQQLTLKPAPIHF